MADQEHPISKVAIPLNPPLRGESRIDASGPQVMVNNPPHSDEPPVPPEPLKRPIDFKELQVEFLGYENNLDTYYSIVGGFEPYMVSFGDGHNAEGLSTGTHMHHYDTYGQYTISVSDCDYPVVVATASFSVGSAPEPLGISYEGCDEGTYNALFSVRGENSPFTVNFGDESEPVEAMPGEAVYHLYADAGIYTASIADTAKETMAVEFTIYSLDTEAQTEWERFTRHQQFDDYFIANSLGDRPLGWSTMTINEKKLWMNTNVTP